MNEFGEKSEVPKETSLISRMDMQEFILERGINPEDFCIIEKLASFSKNLLIGELHNLFNLKKEGSIPALERLVKSANDEQRRDLYETALTFAKKYNWHVSWNLVRLLEKR